VCVFLTILRNIIINTFCITNEHSVGTRTKGPKTNHYERGILNLNLIVRYQVSVCYLQVAGSKESKNIVDLTHIYIFPISACFVN